MAQARRKQTSAVAPKVTLDARPDSIDFRDRMYVPTLVEVPRRMPLERYIELWGGKPLILDQGNEGACTGFGLAAVANYLLTHRQVEPERTPVSPHMLYDMARRYDEWPGSRYSGSSARGAMKGWHKHGVCAEALWQKAKGKTVSLTHERALDAAARPLGAYYRVNHLELSALHCALAEVGIIFASASVHAGWSEVDKTGVISWTNAPADGGHAFALVGYDERGFWLQNSWGPTWGKRGFALVTYDDWLTNATDVWVARLGAPTQFTTQERKTQVAVPAGRGDYAYTDLRPHVVSLGNNGELRASGTFATTPQDLENIFESDFPRLTANWNKRRILLYAHGGLVAESAALQRVEEYRKALLDAEVYPLAFIWNTDFLSTLGNILQDALRGRRSEGLLDSAKDFMLDRLDDTLELLARPLGKGIWDEMKENAVAASSGDGGALLVLKHLTALLAQNPRIEVHICCHSAGSILIAPMVDLLAKAGYAVKTLSMWAPACSMQLFKASILPHIKSQAVERFSLFTLKEQAEQDDQCVGVYHKSLLYLVSNALEAHSGLLLRSGEPLLGMERFILNDPVFRVPRVTVQKTNPSVVPLFADGRSEWVRAPNGLPPGDVNACHARHHGDFDNDDSTAQSTLLRILGRTKSGAHFQFKRSAAGLKQRRRSLG